MGYEPARNGTNAAGPGLRLPQRERDLLLAESRLLHGQLVAGNNPAVKAKSSKLFTLWMAQFWGERHF